MKTPGEGRHFLSGGLDLGVLEMVRLRSSSNSDESEGNSDELIPGLPEEIAELCLLHVPYPYQALARSVSSSWNKAITDPSFLLSRKTLLLSQPYLFVFASCKSTARIQWQALDPRSGRWFVLPPMPCSAAACPPGLACASLPEDGKLFVLGDLRSDGTSLHTTIMYRASTNQWSLASPMRTPRTFFAAGSIKGKIFAAGGKGLGAEDSISTVERYDPVSDTWAAVAKMRAGISRYDAAVVGNKLYVTEGWTWPFSFSPRGGVYDADRDTWQEMRPGMREGWTGISVVLMDKLFVLSEYGDCRMKVYVADQDTWHPVGGGRFPCEALQRPFAMSTVEDRIYVVSRGLHVAVGKVHETEEKEASRSPQLWVEWEVVAAPVAFSDFSPSNCQLLYA